MAFWIRHRNICWAILAVSLIAAATMIVVQLLWQRSAQPGDRRGVHFITNTIVEQRRECLGLSAGYR